MRAELCPLTLILYRDQQRRSIRSHECAVGTDGRMRESDSLRRQTGGAVLQQGHVHPVGHGIEQAGFQLLASSGALPFEKRLQHGGIRRHPAGDVADGDAHPAGTGRMPGNGGESALRLNQEIIGLHVGILRRLAVSGDVHGDQRGVALCQFVGSESRPCGRAGREILDEHVRAFEDSVQQMLIRGALDIRHQALFAAIQPHEITG